MQGIPIFLFLERNVSLQLKQAGNHPILAKKHCKTEKDSKLSQNIWYFDKIKSFWKLEICFCYIFKKIVFCPGPDPYFGASCAKKGFRGLIYQIFFRNYWIAIKVILVDWIPWHTLQIIKKATWVWS